MKNQKNCISSIEESTKGCSSKEEVIIKQVKVLKKQSNHGDFILPRCISHLKSPPLYLAIALWGLIKGVRFSRDDVADAFKITPRRAADVMRYIINDRKNVIRCTRHMQHGRGVRVLRLEVTGVFSEENKRCENKRRSTKKIMINNTAKLKEIKTFFLSGSLSSSCGGRK